MKTLIIMLLCSPVMAELTPLETRPLTGLRSDLNDDGKVDFQDLAIMAEEWQMSNYYLDFDGVNDSITVADNAAFEVGTGDFTVSYWLYHPTGYSGTILEKFENTVVPAVSKGYSTIVSVTIVRFDIYVTALTNVQTSMTCFPTYDNTWILCTFTCDRNGNCTAYLNGSVNTTKAISSVSADISNTARLCIGARYNEYDDTITENLKCYLDDIRIYKRCLSAKEVELVYYEGHGWKVNNEHLADGWYSNCDDAVGSAALTGYSVASGVASSLNGTVSGATFVSGGVPLSAKTLTDNFEICKFYINQSGKRIQLRAKSLGDCQIREFGLLNPVLEDNR